MEWKGAKKGACSPWRVLYLEISPLLEQSTTMDMYTYITVSRLHKRNTDGHDNAEYISKSTFHIINKQYMKLTLLLPSAMN
jgi:hypothetical protein